uniref:Uncharacterized protein n=1 Tax=Rousettus aegyptiacus TaxID=9407 RepID=A0A7J8B9W6_ROUAE|nr:hypothetical protein HJG63_010004 [Rousettus aegyptiacus]
MNKNGREASIEYGHGNAKVLLRAVNVWLFVQRGFTGITFLEFESGSPEFNRRRGEPECVRPPRGFVGALTEPLPSALSGPWVGSVVSASDRRHGEEGRWNPARAFTSTNAHTPSTPAKGGPPSSSSLSSATSQGWTARRVRRSL